MGKRGIGEASRAVRPDTLRIACAFTPYLVAAAVIVLNWESISDDVAVHYGPGGEPGSFEQKSPVSVFNFMFGGIALSGLSVLSYAVCLVYLSSRGLIERFHKPIRAALLALVLPVYRLLNAGPGKCI